MCMGGRLNPQPVMKPANHIQQELVEMGSPIADYPRSTPFVVPVGYFQEVAEHVVEHATLEDKDDVVVGYPKDNPFYISSLYFQDSPKVFRDSCDYENCAEPMLLLSKAIPYAVPALYFETLPTAILDGIKAQHDLLVDLTFSKQMPFALADNYFQNLPGDLFLLASADVGEFSINAPAVEFAVPDGYFKTLPNQLLALAKEANEENAVKLSNIEQSEKPSTKIFSLKNIARLAAAAVVIAGIGFGTMKMLPSNINETPKIFNLERALGKIDKSEIQLYVEDNIDEFDMEILLKSAAANVPESASTPLSSMPDFNKKEINAYLNEMGEI